MTAFYNEIEPYAADWLENLIAAGHIAPGVVDRRSIVDIEPADLAGFTQVHFFAGIGGWSLAARLAGWSDDRPLWTGSCPCQPFSVAGDGKGQADARHLWPEFFRLIAGCRPAVVMGEQVAAAVGKSWLDGVFSDLEGIDYAGQAAVVPACAVNAPHRRDRLWFVADRSGDGLNSEQRVTGIEEAAGIGRDQSSDRYIPGNVANDPSMHERKCSPEPNGGRIPEPGNLGLQGAMGDRDGAGSQVLLGQSGVAQSEQPAAVGTGGRGAWDDCEWITGYDGKARRVKSGVRLLAHGVSGRVGQLRALGNAIIPQVAAEIIGAYLDTERAPAPVLVPPLPY